MAEDYPRCAPADPAELHLDDQRGLRFSRKASMPSAESGSSRLHVITSDVNVYASPSVWSICR
jgi:hypothetical protein